MFKSRSAIKHQGIHEKKRHFHSLFHSMHPLRMWPRTVLSKVNPAQHHRLMLEDFDCHTLVLCWLLCPLSTGPHQSQKQQDVSPIDAFRYRLLTSLITGERGKLAVFVVLQIPLISSCYIIIICSDIDLFVYHARLHPSNSGLFGRLAVRIHREICPAP
jgi:hypothetical protein